MQTDTKLEELLAQAQLLSLEDEVRLLGKLTADLRQRLERLQPSKKPRRSILEFEGMDQESWRGVDIRRYLEEGRSSWDLEG